MSCARIAALVTLSFVYAAVSATAQPLGSFRWQLQPFCNVVTVNVTQQGAIYTLDGTDDRCGGGNQAGSVVGVAYMTSLGFVGFGLTAVLPGGTAVHTEATISIASLNGTWRDSAGNNGAFVFTAGAGIGGTLRPVSATGLAAGSITNILIAPNAVSSANITDASVTVADLAAPPRIAFDSGEQSLALTATDVVVRSVTLTAPAAGRIIVNATGAFNFNSNAIADSARCSITTGTLVDLTHNIVGAETASLAVNFVPFAGTRGFDVTAGPNTFNLVCEEFSGDVSVEDSSMTAIYVATP